MAIFGTDGIRGSFNKFPITENAVKALGRALALFLAEQFSETILIVIGRDTRHSGLCLQDALVCGISSCQQTEVILLDVLPTPALAIATKELKAHAGVMITASHNPATDNGIKIFNQQAIKFDSEQYQRLESLLFVSLSFEYSAAPSSIINSCIFDFYAKLIKSLVREREWEGFKILFDCAHGAYAGFLPGLLEHTGASLVFQGNTPNGFNINVSAAALNPAILSKSLLSSVDFTIAFDGDGDRLVLFKGQRLIDPHHLIAILYQHYHQAGYQGGIVTTEIVNAGLIAYCQKKKIPLEITKVGDTFVMSQARQRGWLLGMEPSGHYILLDKSPSSDPLVTAITLINLLCDQPSLFDQVQQDLLLYQQYSCSISFPADARESFPKMKQSLQSFFQDIDGLIVKIRLSGTEPLLRLMLQAPADKNFNLESMAHSWMDHAQQLINLICSQDVS